MADEKGEDKLRKTLGAVLAGEPLNLTRLDLLALRPETIRKLTTPNLAAALGLDPDRLTADERELVRLVRRGLLAEADGLEGEAKERFVGSYRPRPVTPGFYRPPRRPPGPRPEAPPPAEVPATFDELMVQMVVTYLVPMCIEDGIPLSEVGLEAFAPPEPT